jgi:hypothetical protein
MRLIEFGMGALGNLMKKSGYWIKEGCVTFKSLDEIIKNANTLVLEYGKEDKKSLRVIPKLAMITLDNPLLRFPCVPETREFLAKSVAESVYALSGMNSGDFIWEFRGWSDPRKITYIDPGSLGLPLRFWGRDAEKALDYATSNYLRQHNTGHIDQFQEAADYLTNSDDGFVILMRHPRHGIGEVHSVYLCKDDSGRLRMTVTCGEIDVSKELAVKIIPAFGFVHQMLSDITNIPLGSLTIVIAKLYGCSSGIPLIKKLSKIKIPEIGGLNEFAYPPGDLTVRDVDTLIAMMQEFVGRLDKKSLSRANPYKGDQRVLLWSDMAECFRANKAEELGYKIEDELAFTHPQLEYVYKGGAI